MASQASGSRSFLVGDIGGTHSRLAIARQGELARMCVFHNRDFDDPVSLLSHYLGAFGKAQRPQAAALAVAGPVDDQCVTMTNLGWRLDALELQANLQLGEVHLLNDFAAQALAIPGLADDAWLAVGGPEHGRRDTVAVLGPGTGLGVAALHPHGSDWSTIEGEGGHVSLSSNNDAEAKILECARAEVGHVSAEHFLCGPGIVNLYRTIAALESLPVVFTDATSITASEQSDRLSQITCAHLFSLLGGFCGNLALTLGARGGVYLGGGILPRVAKPLLASGFYESFLDKGHFRAYLEKIPVRLITQEVPALHGLAYGLDSRIGPFAD